MAVRKNKSSWWVDLRFNHVRYRKRSPENSRTGALSYEAALRQQLARGESIDKAQDEEQQREQTFEEFAWKWFEEYVVSNNKISEQRTKKNILAGSLVPFFGNFRVAAITSRHIEQYKARMAKGGVTNKTIKNRLTVFNKCLCTAYDWLQIKGAPPKITWPKCTSYRTDYLSPDECTLLLSHAEGLIREMLLTAIRTGMRQSELKGLQCSSIDWQQRIVGVRHTHSEFTKTLGPRKNNRERHMPLDVDLYEMLYQRKESIGCYVFLTKDGRPFTHSRMSKQLTTACRKAGLRRITWHTLRHTFGSLLIMRGVPVPAVSELMGHSNIGTTMRYIHLAPSTLRKAIDMLNPKTMINVEFGQPVVNHWIQGHQQEMGAKQGIVRN
jgi:integrase